MRHSTDTSIDASFDNLDTTNHGHQPPLTMAEPTDWHSNGTVPETPPSLPDAPLYDDNSEQTLTSDTSIPSTQYCQPMQTRCATLTHPNQHSNIPSSQVPSSERQKRQVTINKLIRYSGVAASDKLKCGFRDAATLNPYLRETAKLVDYPNGKKCREFDWSSAKRDAKARGWRVGEDRERTLRRCWEGLGKMGERGLDGGEQVMVQEGGSAVGGTESTLPPVESSLALRKVLAPLQLKSEQMRVERARMPNGKLRKVEKVVKPMQEREESSLVRRNNATMIVDSTQD